MQLKRSGLGHPLLQQQGGRLKHRVRLEALLHRTVQDQISQRQDNHALVMRHERADHGAGLPARQTRRSVVDRFIKAESSCQSFGGEPLQIQARALRRDHQRECRRIRRDHQILGQSAFEPKAGHAERAILVVEMNVDRVVAAFRHAPRHAALFAIGDLSLHRRPVGRIEQRVLVRRHHQQWHQVLEHRTAPRQQRRLAAGAREQAPQGEPAFLRQLSLCNRHETGKPRFGGQQIVVTRILAALAGVVADSEQMALLVIEEVIIRRRQFARLHCQTFDRRNPLLRVAACCGDVLAQFMQPLALPGRCRSDQMLLDCRQPLHLHGCQFAQRRNFGGIEQVAQCA